MTVAPKVVIGMLLMTLATTTMFTPPWTGVVHGFVFDELENPIAGVTIYLESNSDSQWEAVTDVNGYYRFEQLSPGWYTVRMNEPDPFHLISPPCGYYRYELDAEETIQCDFQAESRGSGVVVELGSPVGQGIEEGLILTGNTFQVSVFVYNLASFSPNYPDRLTILGRWNTQGFGSLETELVGATAAGLYRSSNLKVSETYGKDGLIAIEIEQRKWPYLNLDGEMVSLTFQIVSGLDRLARAQGHVAFCIEELNFIWRNHLLYSKSDHFVGSIR